LTLSSKPAIILTNNTLVEDAAETHGCSNTRLNSVQRGNGCTRVIYKEKHLHV
jgi:hypothetical protein